MNRQLKMRCMRTLSALFLFSVPCAFAQTTGELRGTIRDRSNHIVTGARVTTRSEAMSLARICEADRDGDFAVPSLPVGHYTIEVEADGYKTYAQPDVEVTLGHVIELRIEL